VYRQIFALAVDAQKSHGTENELEGLYALIIGGTGGMGRFFAQLMRLHGASVKIVGRNQRHTKTVAKDIDVEDGRFEDAKRSDIVIVSVPIERTRKVAETVGARMKDGSLLIDLS